ncbi:MAG: carboxylating nicotinate-nucleotide diphosphorylase [Solirubrobacterales bacterium]
MAEPLAQLAASALAEDLGSGDVTAQAVVDPEAQARARIVQKAPGVVYGLDLAKAVFDRAGDVVFEPLGFEGAWRDEPATIVALQGAATAILAGERTALNFLGHLSGIATLTARYVEAVRGTGVRILDTRKTTPGLRAVEKDAVRAGGGTNHRMGLHDAILIKENHAAMAGGVGAAVARARERDLGVPIEVECSDLDELAEALDAGAQRILLDNMDTATLREAVAVRDRSGAEARLEASGGVTLETVARIAATGIDDISVGALTHSAPTLDLSLLFEPA